MNVNELRLNNLIQDAKGRVCTVVNLCGINDEIAISAHAKYSAITTLPYQPIPLTEEWLLRLGFKKDERGRFVKEEFFCYLVCGASSGWKTWVNLCKDDFTLALVGQVHQLQNLYFAMTSQELTIKEMKL